jgi:hypothetical protein
VPRAEYSWRRREFPVSSARKQRERATPTGSSTERCALAPLNPRAFDRSIFEPVHFVDARAADDPSRRCADVDPRGHSLVAAWLGNFSRACEIFRAGSPTRGAQGPLTPSYFASHHRPRAGTLVETCNGGDQLR